MKRTTEEQLLLMINEKSKEIQKKGKELEYQEEFLKALKNAMEMIKMLKQESNRQTIEDLKRQLKDERLFSDNLANCHAADQETIEDLKNQVKTTRHDANAWQAAATNKSQEIKDLIDHRKSLRARVRELEACHAADQRTIEQLGERVRELKEKLKASEDGQLELAGRLTGAKERVRDSDGILFAVIHALKEFGDYEGNPTCRINVLQVVRKLVEDIERINACSEGRWNKIQELEGIISEGRKINHDLRRDYAELKAKNSYLGAQNCVDGWALRQIPGGPGLSRPGWRGVECALPKLDDPHGEKECRTPARRGAVERVPQAGGGEMSMKPITRLTPNKRWCRCGYDCPYIGRPRGKFSGDAAWCDLLKRNVKQMWFADEPAPCAEVADDAD